MQGGLGLAFCPSPCTRISSKACPTCFTAHGWRVHLHTQGHKHAGCDWPQALEHFAQLGYPCPPHHNPAEFVADLVSPDSNMEGPAGTRGLSGRCALARRTCSSVPAVLVALAGSHQRAHWQ